MTEEHVLIHSLLPVMTPSPLSRSEFEQESIGNTVGTAVNLRGPGTTYYHHNATVRSLSQTVWESVLHSM